MQIAGVEYRLTMGSDVDRDGMYLEAAVAGTTPPRTIAEVFYSDATGKLFVSCFEENVPLELIEYLIDHGKECLPPTKRAQ